MFSRTSGGYIDHAEVLGHLGEPRNAVWCLEWQGGKMIADLSLSLIPQLDESKAYGEMVEALTTKNLEIGERCGELEATVVDLESSVELSEELEMQQAEDIRDLQVCTVTGT